jgi:hypothetical protein
MDCAIFTWMKSRSLVRSWILAVAGACALVSTAFALPDIYPAPEQAQPDLRAALKTARAEHRRIIVDFGGKGGEFEAMRHMESSSVTEFLNQWKPAKSS